jgi:hypothetical protein
MSESITSHVEVKPEYLSLLGVLVEALNQAQVGKGAERHNLSGETPFERQRMQQISELIASKDGMVYQAIKKITEGVNLPTLDRQVAELLGAINYLAGIIIFLRKQGGTGQGGGASPKGFPAAAERWFNEPVGQSAGYSDADRAAIADQRARESEIVSFTTASMPPVYPIKFDHLPEDALNWREHTTGPIPPSIGPGTPLEIEDVDGFGAVKLPACDVVWRKVTRWRFDPEYVERVRSEQKFKPTVPEQQAAESETPTAEDVKEAAIAVKQVFGTGAAKFVMQQVGARVLSEIPESKRAEFIELCGKALRPMRGAPDHAQD